MVAVRSKISLILLLITFSTNSVLAETIEAKQPGKRPALKLSYNIMNKEELRVVDIQTDPSNEICGNYFKNPEAVNPKKKNPITSWIAFPNAEEPLLYFKGRVVDGRGDCLYVLRVHMDKEENALSYLNEREPQTETDIALLSMIFASFQHIALNKK